MIWPRGACRLGTNRIAAGIRPPETAPRAKRLKSSADTGHLMIHRGRAEIFALPYFPHRPLCSCEETGMIRAPPRKRL
jgi:hypothetical protein